MVSNWLTHSVKRVEVFKDSNVKPVSSFLNQLLLTVPFLGAFGIALCVPQPYSLLFPLALRLLSCSWATGRFLLCGMFLLCFSAVWRSWYIFCQCRWDAQIGLWVKKNHSLCEFDRLKISK